MRARRAALLPLLMCFTAGAMAAPDQVEVSSDGLLAHASGPVCDPSGKLISRFNSTWRLEAPGVWRVVFDKGSPLTEAEKKLP